MNMVISLAIEIAYIAIGKDFMSAIRGTVM